jgi:hypothetical protein
MSQLREIVGYCDKDRRQAFVDVKSKVQCLQVRELYTAMTKDPTDEAGVRAAIKTELRWTASERQIKDGTAVDVDAAAAVCVAQRVDLEAAADPSQQRCAVAPAGDDVQNRALYPLIQRVPSCTPRRV